MSDYAIKTQKLVKRYKRGVRAVDGLDLNISTGKVYGLLGRNGAGKTTTIRLLMGLLRPSAGTTSVAGSCMWKASAEQRSRVAYVSQTQQLYRGLTGEEHAGMLSRMYSRWDMDYAYEMARKFEISMECCTGQLSGGQQRMMSVVLALATRADVMLLDEPAAGLDPIARRRLIETLAELLVDTEGRTILLSTHLVDDVERIADDVGFMDEGKLRLSRPMDELKSSMRRVQVVACGDALPEDITIPGTMREQRDGLVLTALAALPTPDALAPLEARRDIRLQSFPLSLEEIFVALFGDL